MHCPRCNKNFGAYVIRYTTDNEPVDEAIEVEYCPSCGLWLRKPNLLDEIVVDEINLYDITTRYSNCIVEVLENSVTGQTSFGWYRTEDTEVIE